MALTADDKREIAEILRANLQSVCVCGLSNDAQKELSHFMGMVRDIGSDNHAQGIEIMRDHLKYLSRFKKRGEKIGLALVSFFCISVATGVVYLIKEGVKAILTRSP